MSKIFHTLLMILVVPFIALFWALFTFVTSINYGIELVCDEWRKK